MNAEEVAKRWLAEDALLVQPEKSLMEVARALLAAIEALHEIQTMAREALAAIEKEERP